MITPKHLYLVVATILVWATALFSAYSWTTQPQEDTVMLEHRTRLLRSSASEVHAKMSANEYKFAEQLNKIGWQDNRQLVEPLRRVAQKRQTFNLAYGGIVRKVTYQEYDPQLAARVLGELEALKNSTLQQIQRECFAHIATNNTSYGLSNEDVKRWQRSVLRKIEYLKTPAELLNPPASWKLFQECAAQKHCAFLLTCLDYQEATILQLQRGVVEERTR
ncbi:MAG: hypothetical protein AAF840_11110 [Bacteroidota bacterium]